MLHNRHGLRLTTDNGYVSVCVSVCVWGGGGTPPCRSVCVCLRGASFVICFLCCQNTLLCVSNFLSLKSLGLCLTPKSRHVCCCCCFLFFFLLLPCSASVSNPWQTSGLLRFLSFFFWFSILPQQNLELQPEDWNWGLDLGICLKMCLFHIKTVRKSNIIWSLRNGNSLDASFTKQ